MKFAKLLVGLGMVCTGGLAQAQLTLDNPSASFSFSGYDGQPASVTGVLSSGKHGTLWASSEGTVTFTYLGQESGYVNHFNFTVGNQHLNELDAIGTTISGAVQNVPGAVGFSFSTDNPADTFFNGTVAGNARMVYVYNKTVSNTNLGNNGNFQYIIGFNDSCACDGDYDDFVVGVNFLAPTITNNVPEPETYAMLLAGLGLLGFAARRRKQKEAA